MTTNPVVNELLSLLARLQAEYREEYEKMEQKLSYLRQNITAIETTLHLYTGERDLPTPARGTVTPEDLKECKTQAEALLKIAQLNSNLVKVGDAKNLLIAAKKVRGNPRNLYGHLYGLLLKDERFRLDSPGIFRLLSAREDALSQAPLSMAL